MQADERKKFGAAMISARNAIGQGDAFSESDLDLMFMALNDLTMDQVQLALVDHMNSKNGKWRPGVSYIRDMVQQRAGGKWITADEAWARIPKPAGVGKLTRFNARGDEVTRRDYRGCEWPAALLNQVTTEALAVAGPLLEQGDENAARMAFRAAYNRLVEQETAAGRAPKYRVSGGTHEEQQVLLASAAEQGLLPAPKQVLLLTDDAPNAAQYAKFKLAMSQLKLKSLPPP